MGGGVLAQVKCDANGKTILVDYDSGYVNGYKLTNQRMWALMRVLGKFRAKTAFPHADFL